MKVTAPADFSHVTPLERGVAKGEEVDVPDDLGAQLVAQGWKARTSPKKSDPAPVAAQTEE